MSIVHLNIGSNQNRRINIRLAIKALEQYFSEIVLSSLFESPSEGFKGNDFYNVGVNISTLKTSNEVVDILRDIENSIGRDRSLPKFSSRMIDLDLVLYGGIIDETLNVPRKDILKYAFVLAPLAELNPEAIHPLDGTSFQSLWKTFQSKQDYNLRQYNVEKLFE
jgi:2-amino-4-hydroxy-6-hydroxymethyldihydropteridine diphosphokinase